MTNMFYFGSDINLNLNIYSFDTNKITKFDNIYFEINKLINLNLSVFK